MKIHSLNLISLWTTSRCAAEICKHRGKVYNTRQAKTPPPQRRGGPVRREESSANESFAWSRLSRVARRASQSETRGGRTRDRKWNRASQSQEVAP